MKKDHGVSSREHNLREEGLTEERDDLNRELAGIDVGRQKRHLPVTASETLAERQKKSEQRATMSALQILLQNEEYARAFRAFEVQLADADLRLTELHLEAEAILGERGATLDDIRARAGTLADGTRVYRDHSGEVFSESGAVVDPEERAHILWQDDAPSWEEFTTAKQAYEEALIYRGEVEAVQSEVDGAKARIQSQTDPMTQKELEIAKDALANDLDDLERRRRALLSPDDDRVSVSKAFNASSDMPLDMPLEAPFGAQPSGLSAQ